MAKKKRYNYIKKKPAAETWACALTAVLSVLLLVLSIGISVYLQGQGPLLLGALGISSAVMSIFSLLHMLHALRDPEKNYLPVRIAGAAAGIVLLIWILLMVVGLQSFS